MRTGNNFHPPPFLYRLLSPILFLFWFIHACIHAYQYQSARYLWQRLGFIPKPGKHTIWLHAASVGEVNLIQPLCHALLKQGYNVYISCFTASGLQHAHKLFSGKVCITALPIDCWPLSRFFRARLKPQCALIAETELWPETLYQMAQTHIPVIHVNARLSEKSLHAPAAIRSLLVQTLSYFSVHLCRYDDDIKAFMQMGVKTSNIQVMGNLKHAGMSKQTQVPPDIVKQRYILCASTHDNEEIQISSSLLNNIPNMPLLVLAPRHPKRSSAIINALHQAHFHHADIAIRSKNQPITAQTKIYLADTLGEMQALMQHAELVIMGGSFVPVGGHNILEPARLSQCIITGPSDNTIKHDVKALLSRQGIVQVNTLEALNDTVKELLNKPELRQQLGNNALLYCQSFSDILNRYVAYIEALVIDYAHQSSD